MSWRRRFVRVAALVLLSCVPALAEDLLVLKDGRRIPVVRMARRDGLVLFETTKGERFSVREDQVVSPPLASIPSASAPPAQAPAGRTTAPPATTPAQPQTLVLKDGRRIPVLRLARRGGQVLMQTAKGEAFAVPEGDVVEPPLASIPSLDAPAQPPRAPEIPLNPQTLVLKDGRKIPVLRLARRGGSVLMQTAKGEAFSVPEGDVVEPKLDTIASLDVAPETPTPDLPAEVAPKPEAPTAVAGGPRPPAAAEADPHYQPLPDRWSIAFPDDPRIVKGSTSDPYNQNTLKGDRPVIGDSVFLVLTGTLDTPLTARRLPVPGGVSTENPGTFEFFGRGEQLFVSPRVLGSMELFKGQTAFKPKSWAAKVTGAFNLNYLRVRERNLVTVDVRDFVSRRRQDFSLEEAFVEAKLANLSAYYDFVSVRAGIQPFVSDFRGLIFSDFNLGARLFGNAKDNRWQYNAAYFDLLEKDTNSELNIEKGLTNSEERRGQKVFIANVFRQDFLTRGYTFQASFHRSSDEGRLHYDENGVLVRPAPVGLPRVHEVKSKYVGLAGDGHIGRLNVSHAFYYAFGDDELNVVAGRDVKIKAALAAFEGSYDRDWLRFKGSFLFASGDSEPRDENAKGFDSIYDNSNFAGGPFSFWSRSAIALTQTKVLLKVPGSLLPNLRSNKFEGQANFVNPGIVVTGVGLDAELTPKLKGILNANYLRFHKTESLQALLFQPGIRNAIGIDWGAGFIYRPLLNENVILTAGITGLFPGAGFKDIYRSEPCGTTGCGASSRKLFDTFLQLRLTY